MRKMFAKKGVSAKGGVELGGFEERTSRANVAVEEVTMLASMLSLPRVAGGLR
jgi:hypothetical protein